MRKAPTSKIARSRRKLSERRSITLWESLPKHALVLTASAAAWVTASRCSSCFRSRNEVAATIFPRRWLRGRSVLVPAAKPGATNSLRIGARPPLTGRIRRDSLSGVPQRSRFAALAGNRPAVVDAGGDAVAGQAGESRMAEHTVTRGERPERRARRLAHAGEDLAIDDAAAGGERSSNLDRRQNAAARHRAAAQRDDSAVGMDRNRPGGDSLVPAQGFPNLCAKCFVPVHGRTPSSSATCGSGQQGLEPKLHPAVAF